MSDTMQDAQMVTMEKFQELISIISPEYTLCVRGRHAIGKSEGVYQAAQKVRVDAYQDKEYCKRMVMAMGGKIKTPQGYVTEWNYEMGIPVLERRLSQMTEGDIIGLPHLHGEDKFDPETNKQTEWASTVFKSCKWVALSCEFPVLLFLDERNRALDGVKQAVFQLTDSKAFYGNVLHPETKIVIAENTGQEYQVQANDPAEISRCVTVRLEPTQEDWLNYAEDKCDPATIEFIKGGHGILEQTGQFEPDKKYPDRRMWFKLDQELQKLELFETPNSDLFRIIAGSFIGAETGIKFWTFCQQRDRSVSAKDILKDWEKAKKRLQKGGEISNEAYTECGHKIETYLKDHELDSDEAEELARFMFACPPEPCLACWSNIQANVNNLTKVHPMISKLMVAHASGHEVSGIEFKTLDEIDAENKAKKAADNNTSAPSRGARQKNS